MMRVAKEFTFHAAHRDVEASDQCARLHGHTYKVEISVTGHSRADMLIHGNIIKDIYREHIEPHVEHQDLNATLPINPTMENVTRWMLIKLRAELAKQLGKHPGLQRVRVRLWETPTMYAEDEVSI